MCVELHTRLDNGITQEQYILKGIRIDLACQIDKPDRIELFGIYTRLGVLWDMLGVEDNDNLLQKATNERQYQFNF